MAEGARVRAASTKLKPQIEMSIISATYLCCQFVLDLDRVLTFLHACTAQMYDNFPLLVETCNGVFMASRAQTELGPCNWKFTKHKVPVQ